MASATGGSVPRTEPALDGSRSAFAFEAEALAAERRIRMLCRLADGEMSAGELGRLLSMTPSAVSKDLRRMRLDGVVTRRRVGDGTRYRLADARVERLAEALRGIFDDPPEAR